MLVSVHFRLVFMITVPVAPPKEVSAIVVEFFPLTICHIDIVAVSLYSRPGSKLGNLKVGRKYFTILHNPSKNFGTAEGCDPGVMPYTQA